MASRGGAQASRVNLESRGKSRRLGSSKFPSFFFQNVFKGRENERNYWYISKLDWLYRGTSQMRKRPHPPHQDHHRPRGIHLVWVSTQYGSKLYGRTGTQPFFVYVLKFENVLPTVFRIPASYEPGTPVGLLQGPKRRHFLMSEVPLYI